MPPKKKSEIDQQSQETQELLNTLTGQLNVSGIKLEDLLQGLDPESPDATGEILQRLMYSLSESGADDAALGKIVGASLEAKSEEAFHNAQELLMSGHSEEGNLSLLRALTLDPFNVQARLMSLALVSRDDDEYGILLNQIISEEEEFLSVDELKASGGRAWDDPDAHPYIIARSRRVSYNAVMGRIDEALAEGLEVLELDAEDNALVRIQVVPSLLIVGQVQKAGEILDRFEDAPLPQTLWCRVLERHLAGDVAGRDAALKRARKASGELEEFLIDIADAIEEGAVSDAEALAASVAPAWARYPEAQEWLRSTNALRGTGNKRAMKNKKRQ